ncbi:eukaryotic translation initiation factor 3 subunit D-like [Dysidea avara]|uniref:eukaryotic translation initiation factor 3 subunit D-like n=1 Tax=Dysidea avara TaxID=196820 RepID=UPI0033229E18
MAKFSLPVIHDNKNGWGPSHVPEQFKDTPYQPFSKGDRLGKVADFTGSIYQDRRIANRYQPGYGQGGLLYTYQLDEDISEFQLVDTSKPQKVSTYKNKQKIQRNIRRDREKREERKLAGTQPSKTRARDRQRQQRKLEKQMGRRFHRPPQSQIKQRNPSVTVSSSWPVEEEIEFSRLGKLNFPMSAAPEDLYECGTLEYYNRQFDKVTVKNTAPLQKFKRVFHKVTTTDDPYIEKIAKENKGCNVFATDAILATLMTSPRSAYSWDIIVQRVGHCIFFDKRDKSQFDFITVSETAVEPPQDEEGMNSPTDLAMEATFINQNFSQQVLKRGDQKYHAKHPNPFADEDEEVASVVYRYRKWKLRDAEVKDGERIEGVTLVARCEHDAVLRGEQGDVFINIKACNEWDSKTASMDWRKKLDSQKGAVLATEIKNNGFKVAKWTISAILAGSAFIKFGYVSRERPNDSSSHEVLGVQQFKPRELAEQINLNMSNAWGILMTLIDIFLKKEQGKYLILKDPNKPIMRIYKVPKDAFDNDDSGSEDASSDGDD